MVSSKLRFAGTRSVLGIRSPTLLPEKKAPISDRGGRYIPGSSNTVDSTSAGDPRPPSNEEADSDCDGKKPEPKGKPLHQDSGDAHRASSKQESRNSLHIESRNQSAPPSAMTQHCRGCE